VAGPLVLFVNLANVLDQKKAATLGAEHSGQSVMKVSVTDSPGSTHSAGQTSK
jgi:hypothetical protein